MSVPVVGSTAGDWQGANCGTCGSSAANVWVYAVNRNPFTGAIVNRSDVRFNGASFTDTTPTGDVLLGRVLLNNGAILDPNTIHSNTLDVNFTFTTPSSLITFSFPVQVDTYFPTIGQDTLLNLAPVAGLSQTFTVLGVNYHVDLDGFFATNPGAGGPISQLSSIIGSTVGANLYGRFSATPEPSSMILLGAVAAAAAYAARRRQQAIQ